MKSKVKTPRVVLVTGASSGIGKATAIKYASAGDIVYGIASRDFELNGINCLKCDVTNQERIDAVIKTIMEKEGRIDVLLNIAGFGISGSVEFCTMENIEKQMDVNFLGAVRMTKAVLPIMREQHSGYIINITSPAGAIFPMPYQAFYASSKAALEMFTHSLRVEVKDFGIKVCAVTPGDTRTGFTDARLKQSNDASHVYNKEKTSVSRMEKFERKGMTPEKVANVIYKMSCKKNPPPSKLVGFEYKVYAFLNRLVPKRFVLWLLPKMY